MLPIKMLKNFYSILNRDKLLININKTNHRKNVLISYINHPFRNKKLNTHTNIQESLAICRCFDILGYNCDISNYNSSKKIKYDKYDVIFGFGDVFEKSIENKNNSIHIYYGTGKHPYFSNIQTLKRGLEFKKEKKIFLKESLRLLEQDYSLQTVAPEALILLGDSRVVKTYKDHTDAPCYKLNSSFIKTYSYKEIIEFKNFSLASKHFLFLSGGGMIHKGLDLLLEFFSKQKDLHLHICAPVESETRFSKIFFKELKQNKNIHNYNFLNQNSETFKKILEKCAFTILPSCSEGMPTSILNAIGNAGLIPILSIESSIGIDDLCIMLNSINQNSLIESIKSTQKMTPEQLKEHSLMVADMID